MPHTAEAAEISIASGITEAYVLPLLVMLTSLKDHLPQTLRPILYLVHGRLSNESLRTIDDVVETRPIYCDDKDLEFIPAHSHFPPEAASPLLLADVLPTEVSRVLFLDADLLVLDDVSTIWSLDLEQRVIAAAPDTAIPRCGSPRGVKDVASWGISDNAVYFNAGVLVIDLDSWRKREVTPRALEYLRHTGDRVDQLHQEALNAVLADEWLALSPRWNLLGGVAGRVLERPRSEAWRDPGIIHFAGRLKPWRAPVGGHFNQHYQAVLERVRHLAPKQERSLTDTLYSVYDRSLRNAFYPMEHFLWSRRIL